MERGAAKLELAPPRIMCGCGPVPMALRNKTLGGGVG